MKAISQSVVRFREHIKQMQNEFTPEDTTSVLVQAWLSRCGED